MRKIEFRGKAVNGGAWVYGYYIYDEIVREHLIIPVPTNADFRYAGIPVDPKTIGQYVSRTDKNNRGIYQGDIARAMHYIDRSTRKKEYLYHVIVWSERWLQWQSVNLAEINVPEKERTGSPPLYLYIERNDFEIVGNVHDNPELMEGK